MKRFILGISALVLSACYQPQTEPVPVQYIVVYEPCLYSYFYRCGYYNQLYYPRYYIPNRYVTDPRHPPIQPVRPNPPRHDPPPPPPPRTAVPRNVTPPTPAKKPQDL